MTDITYITPLIYITDTLYKKMTKIIKKTKEAREKYQNLCEEKQMQKAKKGLRKILKFY